MKRLLLIAIVILSVLAFAGCGKEGSSAPTAAPETQAHTDAPYLDTQLNEPEWTLAEGVLQLSDQNTLYADSKDILYFAFITNTDGTQELRFRLSDETAQKMKSQSPDTSYFITLNGEKIGNATLNDDCTEAIVTQENAVGDITALASKIRGLSEQ